jgi:hypothetical protein
MLLHVPPFRTGTDDNSTYLWIKEHKMTSQTRTTTQNALVDTYIAIWNEQDATQRRALIAQLFTEDASYLDPLMAGQGHNGIDAMIEAAQQQFAGLSFRPLDRVDEHNNHMRFSWELAAENGSAIAGGTDFATLAADGRIQTVIGFLDFMPNGNA